VPVGPHEPAPQKSFAVPWSAHEGAGVGSRRRRRLWSISKGDSPAAGLRPPRSSSEGCALQIALTALGDHYPSEAWAWIWSAASPPSNWHGNGPYFYYAATSTGPYYYYVPGTLTYASLFDLTRADVGPEFDPASRTRSGGALASGNLSRSVTSRAHTSKLASWPIPSQRNVYPRLGFRPRGRAALLLLPRVDCAFPVVGLLLLRPVA